MPSVFLELNTPMGSACSTTSPRGEGAGSRASHPRPTAPSGIRLRRPGQGYALRLTFWNPVTRFGQKATPSTLTT